MWGGVLFCFCFVNKIVDCFVGFLVCFWFVCVCMILLGFLFCFVFVLFICFCFLVIFCIYSFIYIYYYYFVDVVGLFWVVLKILYSVKLVMSHILHARCDGSSDRSFMGWTH